MKYCAVLASLVVGFASAAPAPGNEKLEERGGGVACLAVCAPLAAELPLYAACLAACTASGTEGEPVEAEAIVEAYLNEHK